jgi:uncharacterized pyridoxal phosphate-containing UPF0001 family protein
VAAAEERTAAEVKAAIQAGIRHVGHNYVQEARAMIPALANERTHVVRVSRHMIGHLHTTWRQVRYHDTKDGSTQW